MADDRADPSEQIPEADLIEQQTPLDRQGPVEPDEAPADRESEPGERPGSETADEGDRLEQATPLAGTDDDEYPHESPGAGGESSGLAY